MNIEPLATIADDGAMVDIDILDPTIRLDIRYATTRNLTGRQLYRLPRALLREEAACDLVRANTHLRAQGFGLILFDAYRPWSVTKAFWDLVPEHRAYLADPAQGSVHNRGCAVDISMFSLSSGLEVGMPSEFDEMSPRSAAGYAGGDTTATKHRDTLREAMELHRFAVHPLEWWHFDHEMWQRYPVLDVPFEEIPRAAKVGMQFSI